MVIKCIFLFITLLTTIVLCQTDTLDTIILKGGETLKGKVLIVKTDVVEFVEESTSIIYEYYKTKINLIILSSGKTIDFNKSTTLDKKEKVLAEEQEEDTERIRFGIGGGVLFALKSENYDNGTGGNLFLELRTASIISVKANVGWYSADTRVDYLSKGNSSFVLMELSLLFRAMSGVMQPYGGLGIGYYSIDNSLDDEAIQYFNQLGLGIREQIEDGIGFHVRGGFDLIFESNFGLFVDLKYLIFNPKATATVYELNSPSQEYIASDEIQLNNINLILGFVILF